MNGQHVLPAPHPNLFLFIHVVLPNFQEVQRVVAHLPRQIELFPQVVRDLVNELKPFLLVFCEYVFDLLFELGQPLFVLYVLVRLEL